MQGTDTTGKMDSAGDHSSNTLQGSGGAGEVIRGRRLMIGILLMATCLMVRMPGLMALPIFGDEAIYLRWAQLVRGEGVSQHYWWVSLADPKPPLHYWLLAGLWRLTGDPLASGRLLSVLLALPCVPLVMKVCEELGWLLARGRRGGGLDGKAWGILAAVLFIFCPFLGFHQRLATAESLFVLESLWIVWLSLRWGRMSVAGNEGGAGRAFWRGGGVTAVGLGVAIGMALMTRQGVSYTLCALPVVAWVLHAWRARGDDGGHAVGRLGGAMVARGVGQLMMAGVIAGVMWMPYLGAELRTRALSTAGIVEGAGVEPSTRDLVQEVKRRVLYQEQFTAGENRGAIILRNLEWTFVPWWGEGGWSKGEPISGWLFLYLTPWVYACCVVGVIYMAVRGKWRAWMFLVVWMGVTLGPVILLGNVVYSRYVLTGVLPLLLAAAYFLGEVSRGVWVRYGEKHGGMVTVGLLALWLGTIAWPMKAMATQASRWWEQTLTARDRYQYVTGWTAGYGTREAIGHLRSLAREGPMVLITDGGWGTPADALWVYLSDDPNVMMAYVDDASPVLKEDGSGEVDRYLLRRNKWLFSKSESVRLPPPSAGVPVLYVTNDPVHGKKEMPAEEFLRKGNTNLELVTTFKGVVVGRRQEGENVALFHVVRP